MCKYRNYALKARVPNQIHFCDSHRNQPLYSESVSAGHDAVDFFPGQMRACHTLPISSSRLSSTRGCRHMQSAAKLRGETFPATTPTPDDADWWRAGITFHTGNSGAGVVLRGANHLIYPWSSGRARHLVARDFGLCGQAWNTALPESNGNGSKQ